MSVVVNQVYSSAPHIQHNRQARTFRIDLHELVFMIISTCRWKKWYPDVKLKLYCDDLVYSFLEERGMLKLYDEVDTNVLASIPSSVDQRYFWAASKVYAYRDAPVGSVFYDTDLLLNTKFDLNVEADLVAAYPDVTPDNFVCDRMEFTGNIINQLATPKGYSYPSYTGLLRSEDFNGVNASFLKFNSDRLKTLYTQNAIEFMEGNELVPFGPFFASIYICFAEQVMLFDAANHLGSNIKYITNTVNNNPHTKELHLLHHLSHEKGALRTNPKHLAGFLETYLPQLVDVAPDFFDEVLCWIPSNVPNIPLILEKCLSH